MNPSVHQYTDPSIRQPTNQQFFIKNMCIVIDFPPNLHHDKNIKFVKLLMFLSSKIIKKYLIVRDLLF